MAYLTDLAMQAFDRSGKKEVYPIHFTCLGWEAIAVKVTSDPYILSTGSSALCLPCDLIPSESSARAFGMLILLHTCQILV
jgi:hypothetical protein